MDPPDRVGCKAVDIETALKKVQIEPAKLDMPELLERGLRSGIFDTTENLRQVPRQLPDWAYAVRPEAGPRFAVHWRND